MQRRHERKKEKRKKTSKLQQHVQQNSLEPCSKQTDTTGQPEETRLPLPQRETVTTQPEKPQKTVIKPEPKMPKAKSQQVI